MGYDYASDLLGGGKSQESSAPHDYAGELLGSKDQPALTSNIKMESDTKGAAGVGTIAAAGFSDDPHKQIEYYASKRFPNLKPAEAIDRYGVISGQVFYRGDDNKLHQEVPDGYSAGSIVKNAATAASKAIPFVSGLAGGIASAPMLLGGPAGFAGSMGIAGAAASAGELLRQWIGKKMTGDPIDAGEIAMEGGMSAIGQGIGGLLAKYGARNVAQDIGHMNSAKSQALRAKATKEGIQLTPAEETGLASLKNRQKYTGNMPQSMNEMDKFYGKREGQVNTAINRYLSSLSPVDSIEEAGTMGVNAANKAVTAETAKRAAAAKPIYDKAYRVTIQSSPELNSLISRPSVQDAFRRAAKLAADRGERLVIGKDIPPGVIDSGILDSMGNMIQTMTQGQKAEYSVKGLHYIKMGLDDAISGASVSGMGNTQKAANIALKDRLLGIMDAAAPDYKTARKIYADASPGVTQVKEGLVGKLSELEQLTAKNAASILLGRNSGPVAIRQAMSKLQAASPEATQALKRAYLQDVFERASKETVQGNANVAGNFRKIVFGNPQQVTRLQAALTTKEFSSLSDLADVLQAASSVKRIGSDTAWNEATKQAEEAAARPLFAKLLRNVNPAQALRSFDEWLTTRSMGNNAEAYARAITQPGASDKLAALQKLSPQSVIYRVLLGDLLAKSSGEAVSSVVKLPVSDDNRRIEEIIGGATTRLNQR